MHVAASSEAADYTRGGVVRVETHDTAIADRNDQRQRPAVQRSGLQHQWLRRSEQAYIAVKTIGQTPDQDGQSILGAAPALALDHVAQLSQGFEHAVGSGSRESQFPRQIT